MKAPRYGGAREARAQRQRTQEGEATKDDVPSRCVWPQPPPSKGVKSDANVLHARRERRLSNSNAVAVADDGNGRARDGSATEV